MKTHNMACYGIAKLEPVQIATHCQYMLIFAKRYHLNLFKLFHSPVRSSFTNTDNTYPLASAIIASTPSTALFQVPKQVDR